MATIKLDNKANRRAHSGRHETGTAVVFMLGQEGHAREGLEAGLAAVLLDVRVGLEVGAQVAAIGKGAAAMSAAKGLFT